MEPTKPSVQYTKEDIDNSTSFTNNGSSGTSESSEGQAVTEWRLDMRTSDKRGAIVVCASLTFMMVAGVFGNTLTVVAIRTTPRLRTKSNTLIAGLAAIDLIICGPFGVFNVTYQMLVFVFNNDPCKYHTLVGAIYPVSKLPYFAGTVTLIGIAVDRYVAIVHSLRYEALVTAGRIRTILGMSWVYALVMASMFAFWLIRVDWNSCDYPYSPTMNLVIDLTEHSLLSATMVALYTRILFIAVRQQRKIEAESRAIQPTRNGQEQTAPDAARTEWERQNRKRWIRELRAARMTAVLVAAYVLLTVPYFVARGLESTGILTNYTILDVTISIAALNISLDWLLYPIFNKEYRKAYRRLLTCCCWRRSSAVATNTETS